MTPIFKKLDAFIPALSLLLKQFRPLLFVLCIHKTIKEDETVTNPCVFLFIILYIVNVCIFEWYILQSIIGANFQKAGRLHSCLIMFRGYSSFDELLNFIQQFTKRRIEE